MEQFKIKNVNLITGDSQKTSYDEISSYDLLFIDGDHSYQGCLNDLNNWWSKLSSGGHIILHDCYAFTEVQKAVIEFLIDKNVEFIVSPYRGHEHWFNRYQVLCAILLKNSRYQNFNKIMMKNLNLNKSFTLIVVLSIYFIGFIFREISNGAAHTDLEFHIWKIIVDFKLNFSDSFKNYVDYEEGTLPFFHLFQTFINPFNNDIFEYTLSNTILNLLIPIILFLIIKKKLNSNIAFYISLLLLISPWFRSTSYWGTTENFALFFIIPSLIYFEKIINSKDEYVKNNIFLIIFLSFSIYARQQYFFLVM